MTISWYGEACFLLETGGTRILIEPPSKESGMASPRLKSDILITTAKPLDNENEAFIINSPGEYEIKGINILGIGDPSNSSLLGPEGPSGPRTAGQVNVIYSIEIDEIKIAHLGFLNKELDNEKLELLDDPDIILVPVGGLPAGRQGIKDELFDAEMAMKLINKIEPKIAIPMLYDIKGLKIKRAPISDFIKESEAKDPAVPKLVVKKKDLAEEETKIVILENI